MTGCCKGIFAGESPASTRQTQILRFAQDDNFVMGARLFTAAELYSLARRRAEAHGLRDRQSRYRVVSLCIQCIYIGKPFFSGEG